MEAGHFSVSSGSFQTQREAPNVLKLSTPQSEQLLGHWGSVSSFLFMLLPFNF